MMSRTAVTVLLMSLLIAALPGAESTAAQKDPWKQPPSGTIVVGDSITYHGADELAALEPTWKINGVRGRKVHRLYGFIRNWVDYHGHPPDRLVAALGSNITSWWKKKHFESSIRPLPAETEVYFVTPFRKNDQKDETLARYAKWMRQIIADRPNTYRVYWRWNVKRNLHWLADGVHPNQLGQNEWASMLSRTVRRNTTPPQPSPGKALDTEVSGNEGVSCN